MNNVIHGKTTEKLRNGIEVKLLSNKKYYSKWKSKQLICSTKYLRVI